MVIAAELVIAKAWEKLKCPPIDEWITMLFFGFLFVYLFCFWYWGSDSGLLHLPGRHLLLSYIPSLWYFFNTMVLYLVTIVLYGTTPTIKKDKLETVLAKWMHLVTILLTEINQTHIHKCCMVSLVSKTKSVNKGGNVL